KQLKKSQKQDMMQWSKRPKQHNLHHPKDPNRLTSAVERRLHRQDLTLLSEEKNKKLQFVTEPSPYSGLWGFCMEQDLVHKAE
ncbi:hypothetical protein AVEN_8878-1, partial [Araneus ventricosus]